MPLFGTSHAHRIWLCTDGCGLICATITWTLHIFAWSTMTKLVIYPYFGFDNMLGLSILCIYSLVIFMALASHAEAMFTNPGAVPKDAEPPPQDLMRYEEHGGWRKKRWCNRCKGFKPMRAHHDSVTGRCIVKLDHYCPWVNNAVGIFNHKFFLLFVLYTFIQCLLSLSILIFVFTSCAGFNEENDDNSFHPHHHHQTSTRHMRGRGGRHLLLRGGGGGGLASQAANENRGIAASLQDAAQQAAIQLVENGGVTAGGLAEGSKVAAGLITKQDRCGGLGMLTALVVIEGILFGLFTMCMLCDQSSMLFSNETKIDRLKGEKHADSKVNEVFGVGGYLNSFLPTAVKFPASYHDEIVGYVVPKNKNSNNNTKNGSNNGSSSTTMAPSPHIEADEVNEDTQDNRTLSFADEIDMRPPTASPIVHSRKGASDSHMNRISI